jgi:hypothetical protein
MARCLHAVVRHCGTQAWNRQDIIMPLGELCTWRFHAYFPAFLVVPLLD